MEWMLWIIAYFVLWALAMLWSAITSPRINDNPNFEKVRDGGVAVLAFLSGMAAVGFVAVGLEKNIGVLIILVLSFGGGLAALSSLAIGEYRKKTVGANQKKKQLDAETIPTAPALAWLKTKDEKKQQKIIATLNDQHKLCEAAIHSPYSVIRHCALNKITDDDLLIKIVQETDEKEIFSKAIAVVSNQDFLTNIVLNVPPYQLNSIAVRRNALSKLHEQADLKKIALEIYLNDPYRGKRSNISDDDREEIFRVTVDKIDDQAFMAGIAMDVDANHRYRNIALKKITDPDALYRVVLQSGIGFEFVDRFSAEQIAELLMSTDFKHMRGLVKNLSDKKKTTAFKPDDIAATRLLQFLEFDSSSDNIMDVINLLRSRRKESAAIQKMLFDHVQKDRLYRNASYLRHLTDMKYLADIAMHSCDKKVFGMALERIKNPEQKKAIMEFREKNDLHDWRTIKGRCKKCCYCETEVHYGETRDVRVGQLAIDTICTECGKVKMSQLLD